MWPEGYGRRVLDMVDSTNAEAARRVGLEGGPEWICALRQSAGRGRRGRAWVMPEGNFAATLLLRVTEPPEQVALRSFVASIALRDAVARTACVAEALSLKWPNDVLLNGGKLAGILLESLPKGHLAIGIGVNLRAAPAASALEEGAVPPVALWPETGVLVTPEAFLEALAEAYAAWETRFVTYGFAPIRTAWLAQAARLGETVTARTARQTTQGRFETVDERGQLVLKTPNGPVAIAAADVFF